MAQRSSSKRRKKLCVESDYDLLWKMAYARESFTHVVDCCDFIENEDILENSPIYCPIVVAIHVLYARPFRRSRGIVQLADQMIRAEHREVHEHLLKVRDQIAAHTDTEAATYRGLPANNIRLLVDGAAATLVVNEVRLRRQALPRIRALCQTLVDKTSYHITRMSEKLRPSAPRAPGEYLLDLKRQAFVRIEPTGMMPDDDGRAIVIRHKR